MFGLPTKYLGTALRRRPTVLRFAHLEGTSATVIVRYDRGVGRWGLLSYVCFNFGL